MIITLNLRVTECKLNVNFCNKDLLFRALTLEGKSLMKTQGGF